MKLFLKKFTIIIILLYLIFCIVCNLFYGSIISMIGNNQIIFSSLTDNYMVFLGDDDTVNFVKLEDIFIAPFGLSKIPIVSKEIIYDLEEPNKSVIKYSNSKEYLLDDEFGLLSEGIVIKTIQLKNEYGAPFYYPVYYGVCINEKEIGEIEKYYIDDNRHIYVFMCEDYNDNMRKMYNKSF